MKKLLPFAGIVIIWIYVFPSCSTDSPCMDGEGPLTSETRNVSGFTGISLECEAIVHIQKGTEFSISVSAEKNLLPEIKIEKSGNDLRIYTDHCLDENEHIQVFIDMPSLNSIDISGSGNVIVEGVWSPSTLNLDISGSGNISCYDSLLCDNIVAKISGSGIINILTVTPNITVDISGSGDMVINGTGDIADYDISGSGTIRAFNFDNEISHIDISGSGDTEVNTSDLIDGKISGSGDIYFMGSPTIDVDITGSGHLIYVP